MATWAEVEGRFCGSPHRRGLADGLRRALVSLKHAGCRRAYIDGSFVTTKERPQDFDGCWEEEDVDPERLHPALLIFDESRAVQKAVFGGEMFPASAHADHKGALFLRFFQTDKSSGKAKGIICIDLTEWNP